MGPGLDANRSSDDVVDFYDLPMNQRVIGYFLSRQRRLLGDRQFLTIGGNSYSFADVDRHTRAIARGLAAKGVGDGDRVLVMLPNCAEFIFTWFGLSLIGAAICPVSTELKGDLLDHRIMNAQANGIIIDAECVQALASVSQSARDSLAWTGVRMGANQGDSGSIGGDFFYEELYIAEGPDPEIERDHNRIQLIGYTSGTTGPSKGAMMPSSHCFALSCNLARVVGLTADDVIYSPLPLYHQMSTFMATLPALIAGARVVVGDRFSASRYFPEAARHDATIGIVVHALVPFIKSVPPSESDRTHRVRALFNSGHDLEFEERFGVHLVEAFALTETGYLLYTRYPERRIGSTGLAHEDWDIQLVDDEDNPVPRGQAGELVARPRKPGIMLQGYLNNSEATAAASRNLWWHTGDILRQDEDGYFFFVDRKKDRIRRRGQNIASAEVEQAVLGHPAVAECAAVPYPIRKTDDEVRVVVVLRSGEGLEAPALHAWLEDRLPRYMVPRFIEFTSALPRTGTGKLRKPVLVQQGLGEGAWDAELATDPGARKLTTQEDAFTRTKFTGKGGCHE